MLGTGSQIDTATSGRGRLAGRLRRQPRHLERARAAPGPLGLQIGPLRRARAPYFFKGARLRGTRCIWSASTVSGAELLPRPAQRLPLPQFEGAVQMLARVDGGGSVFDPIGVLDRHHAQGRTSRHEEITEQFVANTHPVHDEHPARR